jgi:hypothetical protein
MDFTANNFVGRSATYHSLARKFLPTTGAMAWFGGVVFNNTLNKAFYQSTFATLAVFKYGRFALQTRNLHGANRPFLVRFRHKTVGYNLSISISVTSTL